MTTSPPTSSPPASFTTNLQPNVAKIFGVLDDLFGPDASKGLEHISKASENDLNKIIITGNGESEPIFKVVLPDLGFLGTPDTVTAPDAGQ
ncbi:hypothetical protein H1R20_g3939, partial [Candolleomyces eurysporus]